jgi:hypothetical protein
MDSEPDFVPERNVFERVAVRGANVDIRTPLGSFLYTMGDRFGILRTPLNLTDNDLSIMYDVAQRLPDVGHKNPAAFIYAYKVTKHGDIPRQLAAALPPKLEYGVTLPDVLRYARLILRL